jgi:hypothetical protein
MPLPIRAAHAAPGLAALAFAGGAATAAAQAPPRRHVEHAHAWYQLFAEHRLDARWTLLGEAQVRRADIPGRAPQQLLLRTGLQREVGGARLAAGYAYAGTSVYGEAPAAAPFDEHRAWQMLQVGHRTGAVAWAHRFRTEQRWIEQTTAGTPWRFRQRARVMTRATVDAPSLGVPIARAYVTPWGELLLQTGATPDGQVFDQSRLALQAGYRLSPRLRVEAGYLQQLIQRGGSRTAENNHTLVLSVFSTTGP